MLLAAAIAGALLLVAARLTPDARGLGTHEQLGMAPCSFLRSCGLPCPTCGMTTAFAHAVRGEVVAALRAQLLGTVLALGCALASLLGLAGAIAGRRPARIARRPAALILVVLALASWGAKVLLWQRLLSV